MVGVVDSTLKFALSALWNLTDEMPVAARNFIECQGLELYEEVLEVEGDQKTHRQTAERDANMRVCVLSHCSFCIAVLLH